MKNIIKAIFVAVAMTFSLSSCRDNASEPDHGPVTHPQEEAKGTYEGEWSKTENGNEVGTSMGTLVLSPSDVNYVANLAASCPALSLDMSFPANIFPGGEGYRFYNTEAGAGGNNIGSEQGGYCMGAIKKSDNSISVTIKYTFNVTKLKKQTDVYTFVGTKK
ncbi:MAG: hypothetical protein K2G85_03680 [Muribaculaceae bacterium]|nr:hypothetical protein [Muribaculaceae bacterium]